MRRILFAGLAGAAIGFLIVASVLPRGGRHDSGTWGGEFLGMSGMTLAAVGAGLGLVIGLALAWRRSTTSSVRGDTPAPLESAGPSAQVRNWLRKRRRRDAPKRFGKRGG